MPTSKPSATALRVAGLSQSSDNTFELHPDAGEMAELAAKLDLSSLKKLRFEGRVVAQGSRDWRLEARLGATVVQPCVVTLDPVTTRIDTDVVRQYLQDYEEPDEPEAEMPEDETLEPLGAWIDPWQVMVESLALAVPDYPRKGEAELGQMVYTEPGEAPMTDEDAKPFAGLSALRKSMDENDD
jgi:uncharacterized metal-binding protein YceD (DUF177 family)